MCIKSFPADRARHLLSVLALSVCAATAAPGWAQSEAKSGKNAAPEAHRPSTLAAGAQKLPAERWWNVPLSDRLNRGFDGMASRMREETSEPLGDRLNRGLDNLFDGVSLLFKAPKGQNLAWWEQPLADRINARIDRLRSNIAALEARDIAHAARQVALTGPVIWPDRVLPVSGASVDPQAPLSLLQAWQSARVNDPGLRAARAALAGSRERVPQARAQLLPQVQLGVTRLSSELTREGQNAAQQLLQIFDRYPSSNDTLSLRQPLLRAQQVAGVKQAQAVEREAEAVFSGEEQAFSVRVVVSYLDVLLAQDSIALFESQREFLQSALAAAKRSLAAGVGTRTDEDAAQARLDLNRAQLLQARQQLELNRRQLQSWINRPFGPLVGVDGDRLRRSTLTHESLDEWLSRAFAGSPELRRLQAQRDAMAQELNKVRAGHLPTVDFVAQVQRSRSENTLSPQSSFQNRSMGFQLSLPLYNGGAVNSVTREVSAELERLEEVMQALRLDIGVRVHREFRGVVEGAARVQALEAAVRSAQVALDSARKSVLAGVRTQVDVLNAEQQLSQAKRDLSESRYGILASLVRLKALAGESDETLMARINAVLDP